MNSIPNENDNLYDFDENEEILDATRIQMVLGSLEKSLVDKILENVENIDIHSGAAKKTYDYFFERYRRKPNNLEELIRKSNLSQLPGLAKQALEGSSKFKFFERLDQIINVLQIYKTRSQSFAHPGNEYNPVHWVRVQALALDPVIKQLGFINVIERFYSAKKGILDLSEINHNSLVEIPNNLPMPDFDEIIGRDEVSKQLRKYLLNPRKPSISIFGAGGTGKTALALSVLNELKYSEEDSKEIDCILFASLKEEYLEEGRVRKEIIDLTIDGIKKQFLEGFMFINSEFSDKSILNENFILDDNINLSWENFLEIFGKYRFLLWVDNLETLSNDIVDVFSNFETNLPRDWKIIITSRIRIRESSSIISLGPLDKTNAAKFFQKIYFEKLGQKVNFDNALDYAEKLFCNPLAIKNAIGFQKKNNTSLVESIQCGAESIIAFSFTRLVNSLSETSKNCLEVLFVFGESRKIDINKRISIDIDNVSESISEIEDLGLASRGTSSIDSIKLNDNFRSYLSIYPLNEELRFNLNIYKDEQLNINLSPSNAENNQWSSQMKYSYLRPETQIDDTCRVICNEAIQSLGRVYNINKGKEFVDNESRNDSLDKLRNSLKQLEEFKQSNKGQEVPPAIHRLMGLIYQEFNDQALCSKFLHLAADSNDPNALLTLFYRFDTLQDNRAYEFGCRFFESLENPLPDSVPFTKFITAFSRLCMRQNKFDDVYKVTNDWDSRKPIHKSLFLILLAEAHNKNALHLLKNMVEENINQNYSDQISALLLKSYECLNIDINSPHYTNNRNNIFWWLSGTINSFTRVKGLKKNNILFKGDFCKMIISLHQNHFARAYNESYTYQKQKFDGDRLNENLIKITAKKEFFEDLYYLVKELPKIEEYNNFDISKTRWYEEKEVILRFNSYAGFDKKLAIFEDNDNKTYRITNSAYNFFSTKNDSTRGKLTNYYKLTKESKIKSIVYKNYTNHKLYEKRRKILNIK